MVLVAPPNGGRERTDIANGYRQAATNREAAPLIENMAAALGRVEHQHVMTLAGSVTIVRIRFGRSARFQPFLLKIVHFGASLKNWTAPHLVDQS